MVDSAFSSYVRARRLDAGLSQRELANQVGVSRQALVAIEAGRQVPATSLALQIARVLRCAVEDLFTVGRPPNLDADWSGPPAPAQTRLAVGRVDGRWVAHPLRADDRPADAMSIGLCRSSGAVVMQPLEDIAALERNVLVAGCAPLLGILAERLGRHYNDARGTWIRANSQRALDLLQQRRVHIAGLHLADAADPDAHTRAAQRLFPEQRSSVINLARWRQGLVVAKGNPLRITEGADLLRPDLKCAHREAGSGAHRVLERIMRSARCPTVESENRGPVAVDHAGVARFVRWNIADVGVAIESVAIAEDLDFIPLTEERFDLIVPEARLALPSVARFVDLLGRSTFRTEAAGLPGYDLAQAGHVSTVEALAT